jgi:hypothetical protein
MTANIITQDDLKALLDYNQHTGIFTWKVKKANRIKIGDVAGYKIRGYLNVEINGKPYALHRLAFLYMTGEMPIDVVDHVNGDQSDNRWCNLRNATQKQNTINVKLSKRNTSGHRCIHFNKNMNKYAVRCVVNKVRTHLGYFADINEAISVYEDFAKKHHGEFYRQT